MVKKNLTKEQKELLDMGTKIILSNGDTYRYLPFWFKETEGDVFQEIINFEKLPKDLIDELNKIREGKG